LLGAALDRVAVFIALNSELTKVSHALFGRSTENVEVSAIIREIPVVRVPNLKPIPWLPHSHDLASRNIFPNVMRSLSPVIDNHHCLYILDVQVLSANESHVSSLRVHEVIVQGVDVYSEGATRVGADALLGGLKIIDNPHVFLDVGDVRCLIKDRCGLDVEGHLQAVVLPIIDERTFLLLIAMVLGRIGSGEASNTGRAGFVSYHNFVMPVLTEFERQLGVSFLDFFWKLLWSLERLALSDADVAVLVTPGLSADTFALTTRWIISFVVTSAESIPTPRVAVGLAVS